MLMLSLLADENFSHRILRGLRRVTGTLDVLTVQEVSLRGHKDPEVLAWASVNGRVLLTHDVQPVPGFAHQRMRAGEPMPGVIVVPKAIGIGVAIADLHIAVVCGTPADLDQSVLFLPLRATT